MRFTFPNPFRKSTPVADSVDEPTASSLYEIKGNQNYTATVMRIKTLVKLENADRLMGIPLAGFQAIVDLSSAIGDWGVFFPAETQLAANYLFSNNLYRHEFLNFDPTQKGYFEDNGRVKAVKFRGNTSDCFYMPLGSLAYLLEDGDVNELMHEGLQFDTINGETVCSKYISRRNKSRFTTPQQAKLDRRVDKRNFPEHIETTQWLRMADEYLERDPSREVIVTQKLHGTSIRVGNVPVRTPVLSWLQGRVAKFLKIPTPEREFAMVYGSRKVIKDINDQSQNHYYGIDLYTLKGRELDGLVPKNYVVYGELIGWLPGDYQATDPDDVAGYYNRTFVANPIQKHYTYNEFPGRSQLYVYRVAVINEDGVSVDLSWDNVVKFCDATGLKHVIEVWRGPVGLFDPARWINNTYTDMPNYHLLGTDIKPPVPLSADSPCDEGVCLRFEGLTPTIYKLKSPDFLQHETRMIDEEAPDVEAEESTPDEA